jgi:hypothetical protein
MTDKYADKVYSGQPKVLLRTLLNFSLVRFFILLIFSYKLLQVKNIVSGCFLRDHFFFGCQKINFFVNCFKILVKFFKYEKEKVKFKNTFTPNNYHSSHICSRVLFFIYTSFAGKNFGPGKNTYFSQFVQLQCILGEHFFRYTVVVCFVVYFGRSLLQKNTEFRKNMLWSKK